MVDHLDRVTSTLSRFVDGQSVSPHELVDELAELDAAVAQVVDSFVGLQLTTVVTGCPVTFVRFMPLDDPRSIAASIRVPLRSGAAPPPSPGALAHSVLRLFARTPGAFVDLAADLTIALGLRPTVTGTPPVDGRDGGADPPHISLAISPEIALDADLPPSSTTTGVLGLDDFDTVNQAVGVLIDQGFGPDEAEDELVRRARSAQVPTLTQAERILAAVRGR